MIKPIDQSLFNITHHLLNKYKIEILDELNYDLLNKLEELTTIILVLKENIQEFSENTVTKGWQF